MIPFLTDLAGSGSALAPAAAPDLVPRGTGAERDFAALLGAALPPPQLDLPAEPGAASILPVDPGALAPAESAEPATGRPLPGMGIGRELPPGGITLPVAGALEPLGVITMAADPVAPAAPGAEIEAPHGPAPVWLARDLTLTEYPRAGAPLLAEPQDIAATDPERVRPSKSASPGGNAAVLSDSSVSPAPDQAPLTVATAVAAALLGDAQATLADGAAATLPDDEPDEVSVPAPAGSMPSPLALAAAAPLGAVPPGTGGVSASPSPQASSPVPALSGGRTLSRRAENAPMPARVTLPDVSVSAAAVLPADEGEGMPAPAPASAAAPTPLPLATSMAEASAQPAASTAPPGALAATQAPLVSPSERGDAVRMPSASGPQQEQTIAQVSDLREALRAARPAMTVHHAEFGFVSMRLEQAAPEQWRAVLAARDPGFVPAVQAALADRVIAAAADSAAPQNGTSDQRYGASPNGGQGGHSPHLSHSGTRDGEAAPDHRRPSTAAALAARAEAEDEGAGSRAATPGGLFA